MVAMDSQLVQFYRQYMQQVSNPILPPGQLLLQPDIQKSLEDHFFDASNTNVSPQYQASVLDRVIRKIESAVKNPEDDVVSDALYECRAKLALVTNTDATQKKRLSYFPPVSFHDSVDAPIIIEEAKNIIGAGPNVGLRTWEAALHLACYLFDNPNIIRGRKVLELGAGTGFLSIFCASFLNAREVMATDGIFDVLKGLERNVELNAHLFQNGTSPITTSQLEWGDEEGLASILERGDDGTLRNDYDVVIGADLTYHPDACVALAGMLSQLSELKPDTEILIAATERHVDTLQNFVELCRDSEHKFRVEEIVHKCPPIHDQKGFFHTLIRPIRIYAMSRAEAGFKV